MGKESVFYDVVVVGGGLAGLSLAAALGTYGIEVACIDREEPVVTLDDDFDGRTTAVSYGSQKLMQAAGIWDELSDVVCPIRDIRILDGSAPVFLNFLARDVDNESFGWIIENRLMRKAMYDRLKTLDTVDHIAPANVSGFEAVDNHVAAILDDGRVIKGQLLVGADGRFSAVRDWLGVKTHGWQYNQSAIVCNVKHEKPHHNIALEHFRPEGPFAVLPMTDSKDGVHRSSVVWTEHGDEKDSAIHFAPDVFNTALQERFGNYVGVVEQIGKRYRYPLGLKHAHGYIGGRTALVAEAAHAMHPIAGQGLNMGLRDIAALTELVVAAKRDGADVGERSLLARYQRMRRFDNMMMMAATDGLNRLFSNSFTPVKLARDLGVSLVSKTPFMKQFFMRQAMGHAGRLPKLIRGEAL